MHSKWNCKQGEKTILRIGKSNSKWNNWQRINFQIELIQLNTRKTDNLIKTWEKDLNRDLSKENKHMAKNTRKDAQHCSLFKKCKSKLQWDITSHQSEWPSAKSLQTINAGESVEKREHSCTVSGNVNWYSHYGRCYGDSLEN